MKLKKKDFEVLRKEHHKRIKELQEDMRHSRDGFFDQLSSEDSLKYKEFAEEISSSQKQIELATFEHFKKVRAICNEEQKKKFDEVIKEALRMMAPKEPGKQKP